MVLVDIGNPCFFGESLSHNYISSVSDLKLGFFLITQEFLDEIKNATQANLNGIKNWSYVLGLLLETSVRQ